MRVELCAREDFATQTALLEAFAQLGISPDDGFDLEVPLPMGLLVFRAGTQLLTVFSDAWMVDIEGSDELIKQVLAKLSTLG